MKRTAILKRCRFALVAAAAMMVNCGGNGATGLGPRQPLPLQAERTRSYAATIGVADSWLFPKAKREKLLYVSNVYDVTIYSYPQGKFVGALRGFNDPEGDCVDAAGNVFITDLGLGRIVEYAHGAKMPSAILKDRGEQVGGCAVDPTTGNLAAVSLASASGTGDVAIYAQAQGKPKTYIDPNIYYYYWCGYDDQGNLYVDGQTYKNQFALAELPKGSATFTDITLNQEIDFPGAIQWDGKYVVVGDETSAAVYQFSISGSEGTLKGAVNLGKLKNQHQFWIGRDTIVVTNEYFNKRGGHSNILAYSYPAGGKPIEAISRQVDLAKGIAISKPQ